MKQSLMLHQSLFNTHFWHIRGTDKALCGMRVANATRRLVTVPPGHICPDCTALYRTQKQEAQI